MWLVLAIWDKLPESIFGNFGGSKFSKITGGDLSPKSPEPNLWLLVNHTKPKNTVLKLISFNSRQLQNSGQLQNNTVNGAMSITINCVITNTNKLLY